MLDGSVLHVEHVRLFFELFLVEDATFGPEKYRGHPGKEGAHDGQAKGPGEKVVLVTGHPVTVIPSNAKNNHCYGCEESCVGRLGKKPGNGKW